jgi:hypothetical protein
MPTWTITAPQQITVDQPVTQLDALLMTGKLNVVGTDGPARVEITHVGRRPLALTLTDGALSLRHEKLPSRWHSMIGPIWWFSRGRKAYRTDVSIAVPRETLANLRLVSGTLVASGLHGQTTTDCTSGRIALLGLVGRVRAKMVSGPIEAINCAGELDVETISGEISMGDITARRVHAKTVSGAITCDLDNNLHDSEVRLYTISGAITMRVREDSSLQVSMNAISGRVSSAFPEVSSVNRPGTRMAAGCIGSGTGRLYADATSGNIALLRRPAAGEFDNEGGA